MMVSGPQARQPEKPQFPRACVEETSPSKVDSMPEGPKAGRGRRDEG